MTDNGVVTGTAVRADERIYYSAHALPYTPAKHFGRAALTRRSGPGCRSAPAWRPRRGRRGFAFLAVAADCAYGDQDGFRGELAAAGLSFVMALKPHRGTWVYGPQAYTPVGAARDLARHGPRDPGDWRAVTRIFRDGHADRWFAAGVHLGWWGPDGFTRGGGQRRPGHPAAQGHRVPGHQPAPPRRPARGRQPAPGPAGIVRI